MKKIGKLVLLALLCLNSVVPVNAEEQPLTTIEPEVVETEDAAEISNEENIKLQDDDSVESSDLEVEVTLEPAEIPLIVESNNQSTAQTTEVDDQRIDSNNLTANLIENSDSLVDSKQIVRSMNVEYTDGGKSITISCNEDDYACNSSLEELVDAQIKLFDNQSIYYSYVPSISNNKIYINEETFTRGVDSELTGAYLNEYLIKILVKGENSFHINFDHGVISSDNDYQSPNPSDVDIEGVSNDNGFYVKLTCNEGPNEETCKAWMNSTDVNASFLLLEDGSFVNLQLDARVENNAIIVVNRHQEDSDTFKEFFYGLGDKYSLLINFDEYYSFTSHNPGYESSNDRYKYLPYGTKLEFDYLNGVKLSCPIENEDESTCRDVFNGMYSITVSAPFEMPTEIMLSDKSFTINKDIVKNSLYIEIPSSFLETYGNLNLKEESSIYLYLSNGYNLHVSPGNEYFYYPGAFDGCSISLPNNNVYTVTCGNEDTLDFFGHLSNNASLFLEYQYGSIRLIDYSLNDAENQISFDITKQNYNFLRGEYDDVWLSLYDSPMGGGSIDVNAVKKIANSDNKFVVVEDGKIPTPPTLNVSYSSEGEDAGLWITCDSNNACSAFLDEVYASTQKILDEKIRSRTVFTLWPNGSPIYIPMKDDFEYPNPFVVKTDDKGNTVALLVGVDWFVDHSLYVNEDEVYNKIQLSAFNYLDVYQNINGIKIDLGLEVCNQITNFEFDDDFNGIVSTDITNRNDAITFFKNIGGIGETNAGGIFTYSESNLFYDNETSSYYYRIPSTELTFMLASASQKNVDKIDVNFTFYDKYKPLIITNVDVTGNPYHYTPSHRIIAVADGLIIESDDKDFLKAIVNNNTNNTDEESRIIIRKVRQGPGESYALYPTDGTWSYDEESGTVKVSLKWGNIERLHYKDDYGNNAKIDYKEEYYLLATAPYYVSSWYPEYTISLAPIKLPNNINNVNGSDKKDKSVLSLLEESDDITGLLDDLVVVNNKVNGNSIEGTDIVTEDVTISGLLAAVISSDEEGNLDYSDYNEVRDNALEVTVSTSVEEVDNKDIESLVEYAVEHDMNLTQLSFDINVNKSYGDNNALLNNNLMSITELPMDVALSFELPDSSKNYKLLHEHNGAVQELDVIKDGNEGIAFTNQFSSFVLVEYDQKTDVNSNNTSTSNDVMWDDGGPFITDACGSVFDRWGNKIYDAGVCNVDSNNGYQLVNTSDK